MSKFKLINAEWEILGSATLMICAIGTIIWMGFTNYIGLSENQGWILVFIQGSIVFAITNLIVFGGYQIARLINKHATRRFLITSARKFEVFMNKLFNNED